MSDGNGASTVRLLGRDWPVTLPEDFAAREEMATAYAQSGDGKQRVMRVYAAALGLSTGLGRAAKADYLGAGCDPYLYGGRVYQYLRQQGADLREIAGQGEQVMAALLAALFPRQGEVDAREGFTAAGEAQPTGSPAGSA